MIKSKALEYYNNGYHVIPVIKEGKKPDLFTWSKDKRLEAAEVDQYFTRGFYSKTPAWGVAIVCGPESGGAEIVDVDVKHDPSGKIWDEYSARLRERIDFYDKLVIETTVSKGVHIIYKCAVPATESKLASRQGHTEAMLEMRRYGNYFVCYPTPGYTMIQGDIMKLPTLTPSERDTLIAIAKEFDETGKWEERPEAKETKPRAEGSVIDEYNASMTLSECITLLESHGWTYVRYDRSSDRYQMLRPGDTKAKTSGNLKQTEGLWMLYVHSTSTDFPSEKGLSPFNIYGILEHPIKNDKGEVIGMDVKAAVKALAGMGYGGGNMSRIKEMREAKEVEVELFTKEGRSLGVFSGGLDPYQEEVIHREELTELYIPSESPIEGIERAAEALYPIIGDQVHIFDECDEWADSFKNAEIWWGFIVKRLIDDYLSSRDLTNSMDKAIRFTSRISNPAIYKKIQNELIQVYRKDHPEVTLEDFQEAEIIRRKAVLNKERLDKFDKQFRKVEELRKKPDTEVDKLVKEAEKLAFLKDNSSINKLREIMLLEDSYESWINYEMNKPDAIGTGYKVNIDRSNQQEIEIPLGQLTFFAASTGHGKTLVINNIVLNIIKKYKRPVFFITFEQARWEVMKYALNAFIEKQVAPSNLKSIESYAKSNGTVSNWVYDDKREYFVSKINEFFRDIMPYLKYRNIQSDAILDESLSHANTIALIEEINKHFKDAIVVVDYVQKFEDEEEGALRYQTLKNVVTMLNDAAVSLQMPIILASQFNRQVDCPLDMGLSKNAEASDIEKIASEVIGIWNCARDITRSLTNTEIDQLWQEFGIKYKKKKRKKKGDEDTELEDDAPQEYKHDAIILKVLKSRRMPAGKNVKLRYNQNSGYIGEEYRELVTGGKGWG